MGALNLGKLEPQDLQVVYEATLTGIAKKFYLTFKETERGQNWLGQIATSKSPYEFAIPFYEQFCGSISSHDEQAKKLARINIEKLSICDIGYFEEYLNEFQQYYCTIGELDDTNLVELLHRKLPEPWNVVVAKSMAKHPLERFTVGGVAERIRELLRKQCVENNKSKMARKQLKGNENFCYKILDVPTNWGCHKTNPPQKNRKDKFFSKRFKRNQNKNWKFKKSSNFNNKQSHKKKRFFKRKSSLPEKAEKKKCRC